MSEIVEHVAQGLLIEIANELTACHGKLEQWDAGSIDLAEDQSDAIVNRVYELERSLIRIPATTPREVLAKAKAAQASMRFGIATRPGSSVESLGERHDLLAWSLINDLLAGSVVS